MMIIFFLLLMLRVGQCKDQIIETRTVGVGSDVNLSCALESPGSMFWIRVVSGNFPQFLGRTHGIQRDSHITVTEQPGTFVLHIKKAMMSDTAVYYCMKTSQKNLTFLKATDLRVKGPEPDITAVPPSDPVRPGDSVIQEKCSVLSDSEIKTCPGEHNVCCGRAGSHQYHPGFIHTQGNSVEEHVKNPEGLSTKTFIYSFFMNVTSSDAGSYYCAVATCEEGFTGNEIQLDIDGTGPWSFSFGIFLLLLCAVLAIIGNVTAVLIYAINKNKCDYCNNEAAVAMLENIAKRNLKRNEDTWMYSTVVFTVMESGSGGTRNAKTTEREKIYAAVKAFGLD